MLVSDQWCTVVPIIGSCKKGVRHHGLGAADTLPLEFVRFRLVRTLIHTRQIALCEPKSQTISNMRRSSC